MACMMIIIVNCYNVCVPPNHDNYCKYMYSLHVSEGLEVVIKWPACSYILSNNSKFCGYEVILTSNMR